MTGGHKQAMSPHRAGLVLWASQLTDCECCWEAQRRWTREEWAKASQRRLLQPPLGPKAISKRLEKWHRIWEERIWT